MARQHGDDRPAIGSSSGRVAWRSLLGWGAAGILAVTTLLWWTQPTAPTVEPWCLLRRAGWPCPACGLTRAAGALLRGDFTAARSFHPLALPLLLEALVLWLFAGWSLVQGRPVPAPNRRHFETWFALHAVALVALWLGRTATGTLP